MRMKLFVKSLLIVGFLALLCGYPMQVGAKIFEPFSFHQSAGFLVDSPYLWSTTGENNIGWYNIISTPPPPAGEYNTLAWGQAITNTGGGLLGSNPFSNNIWDGRSGVRVIGHEGTVTTGNWVTDGWGDWQAISTLYHQNHVVQWTSSTLISAVIYSDLWLDHEPEGDIYGSPSAIPLGYQETFNFGGCPDGNPNGSVCDDLFTFPAVGFANETFFFDGHSYEVQFGLANFVNSTTNFPDGCVGDICTVWTAEGVTSSLDIILRIREIPEPATLFLLGLGLLGIGIAKRRGIKS